MPAVSREGDEIITGHGCDTTATILEHSDNVFANGIPVSRLGDAIAPHTILSGITCVPHFAVVNEGSSTVFVNGISVARVGDSADLGNIIQGSSNVFAG